MQLARDVCLTRAHLRTVCTVTLFDTLIKICRLIGHLRDVGFVQLSVPK